jgi:hypothetical protein
MFISLGAVPLKRSAHLSMDWGGPSIQAARVTCSEPIQGAVVMNATHPATFVHGRAGSRAGAQHLPICFFPPLHVVGRHRDGRPFVLVL